jgi:serine/threonine protein phosphatase PrpC
VVGTSVIGEPDLIVCELDESRDIALVLATDGVTNSVTQDMMVEMMSPSVKLPLETQNAAERIVCKALCESAQLYGMTPE